MYLPCGTSAAGVVVLILKDNVNLARGVCLGWDEVLVESKDVVEVFLQSWERLGAGLAPDSWGVRVQSFGLGFSRICIPAW